MRIVYLLITCLILMLLTSCGGGGEGTNGTLSVSAPTSISANSDFLHVDVTFDSPAGKLDQKIKIVSNKSFVGTPGGDSGYTNGDGFVSIPLPVTNNISNNTDVVLTVSAGNISRTVTVSVLANILTIVPSTDFSTTLKPGGIGELQPTGTFITYTDSSGSSGNNKLGIKSVIITVKSMNAPKGTLGNDLIWHINGIDTPFTINDPVTINTDSNGNIPLSIFSVKCTVPATGVTVPVVINFEAVIQDPLGPQITVNKDVTFKFTGA